MKADLHVHSRHSAQSGSLKFLRSRDCYSDPEAVYRTAKARGMDVVTITDHDSIGGCLEFLERHPDATDFIVGEEVSCRFPDGDIEVHLGVYGTTEQLHRELQPLRRNVFDVIALLRERDVFFALNHLLFFYRGQAPLDSYLRLARGSAGARSAEWNDVAGSQQLDRADGATVEAARDDRGQRCPHAAARRHDVRRGDRRANARRSSSRVYATAAAGPGVAR